MCVGISSGRLDFTVDVQLQDSILSASSKHYTYRRQECDVFLVTDDDYNVTTGVLKFNSTTVMQCVLFETFQDNVTEIDEVVILTLQLLTDLGVGSGSIILTDMATITIVDNDGKYLVLIGVGICVCVCVCVKQD